MPEPNISPGTRMIWSAVIMVGCVLLIGLVILLLASFPSGESRLPERAPGLPLHAINQSCDE